MKKKDCLEEIYDAAVEEEYINPIAISRLSVAVPTNPTSTELELQQLARHLIRNKEKNIRFTMDMPVDFHAQILDRIEETGQTMKGYFMALARRDLRDSL